MTIVTIVLSNSSKLTFLQLYNTLRFLCEELATIRSEATTLAHYLYIEPQSNVDNEPKIIIFYT